MTSPLSKAQSKAADQANRTAVADSEHVTTLGTVARTSSSQCELQEDRPTLDYQGHSVTRTFAVEPSRGLDVEIEYIHTLLDNVARRRLETISTGSTDFIAFHKIIKAERALRQEIRDLSEQKESQALVPQASAGTGETAVQDEMRISKDTEKIAGGLSAFGAALSLEVLFTANSGNMWWFFASWWCFFLAFSLTGVVRLSTTGNNSKHEDAVHKNWGRRLIIFLISITYLSDLLGLFSLGIAAASYNVGPELGGSGVAPMISGGPDLRKFGGHIRPFAAGIFYSVVVVVAAAQAILCFVRLPLISNWRRKGRCEEAGHKAIAALEDSTSIIARSPSLGV